MKNPTRIIAATVAALLAVGSVGLASARDGEREGRGDGQAMHQRDGHHGQRGHEGRKHERHARRTPMTAEQVAQRLAKAKTDLAITADQELAWNRFAEVTRTQAAEREAFRKTMQERRQSGDKPTAEERQKLRETMQARHTARKDARDALYAVLNPGQKALANQMLRAGKRGGHHGRHERGEGRMERQSGQQAPAAGGTQTS